MKRRYIILAVAILLALVLVVAVAGPSSAEALETDFTANVNGAYVLPAPVAWTSGLSVEHLRDMHAEGEITSADPRLCGITHITENMNLNSKTGSGTGWGTFTIDVVDDHGLTVGVWEGTFTERLDLVNGTGMSIAEAHGAEGIVAGLKLKWTAAEDSSIFPFWSLALIGTITAN